MVLALAMAFVGYAPAHLARGVCSGSGRFTEYALIMGSDGVVRIALCIVLAAVGITAVGAYGMVIAISPLFAVAYVFQRGGLKTEPGPPADWNEVTPNLGWLLLGSIFAATLLNAGPIAASLLAEPSQDAAGFGLLLRRAAGPHPAVHVPSRAGRPPAPPQPARRPWRAGRLPRRAPASAADRGRHRRGRIARSVHPRSVGARGGVRRIAERADVGAPGVQQRRLHDGAGHRPGGDRPQGPCARRGGLGRRRA